MYKKIRNGIVIMLLG